MQLNKPKVVIAGAGGGKTHQMINEIIKILPELKKYPEKFCVVITYTNSATEEIKHRITKITGIPNNLHISTTHSFLTKFIIDPYAHLFNILPLEKNYIEKVSLPYRARNFFIEKAVCQKIATQFSTDKGLIIYDKILEIANTIINKETVRNQVSNRLAYIFVDEYQDMRIYQHKIFQTIIFNGQTEFYCIGDPLQSIFNFAYNQSQLSKEPKPNNFNESPILELSNSKSFDKETISVNNRCSSNIINFINNYTQIINYTQKLPENKVCNQIPVFFITGENKKEIIEKFEEIISNNNIQKENDKMFNLFVAKDWNTFDDIENINMINNENSSSRTIFNECSRCILASLGMNKTTFIQIIPSKDKRESYLLYRQFCFSILKDIRNPILNVNSDYIIDSFINTFNINLPDDSNRSIDISKTIEKLKVVTKTSNNNRFCSSIHTSKGLEATNVFVIAKTNNQLLKWLDFQNVVHDTDDDYRLGYVAFSRARELLCVASLEKPNKKIIDKLNSLNVVII